MKNLRLRFKLPIKKNYSCNHFVDLLITSFNYKKRY